MEINSRFESVRGLGRYGPFFFDIKISYGRMKFHSTIGDPGFHQAEFTDFCSHSRKGVWPGGGGKFSKFKSRKSLKKNTAFQDTVKSIGFSVAAVLNAV